MSSHVLHDGGDDELTGMSSKKRKVPAFHVGPGRDADFDDFPRSSSPVRQIEDKAAWPYSLRYRFHRSTEAMACSFRKAVFLRRKAALISLYLDAQSAILADSKKGGTTYRTKLPLLPEVPAFEAMIPALEDVGIKEWAPDRPGWRNGWDDATLSTGSASASTSKAVSTSTSGLMASPSPVSRLGGPERWRTGHERRKRRMDRKPILRGGWMPEGSFEFEMSSAASAQATKRLKDKAALNKLVADLRTIVLTSKPQPLVQTQTTVPPVQSDDEDAPSKTRRKISSKSAATGKDATQGGTHKADAGTMSKTNSSQGSEPVATGKKKPKKKKRSVLANQSNPHHVDNYRPTRLVSTVADPFEPYAWHSSLLFPPPMRFLAARPKSWFPAGQAPIVRPSEDDYLCLFCEYELFFGSEQARRRAIRKRRQELRKKNEIKARAKNVTEGKGKLGREEDLDDQYDDEADVASGLDDCYDDDHCSDRCSCGRAINAKSRIKKPPDRAVAPAAADTAGIDDLD